MTKTLKIARGLELPTDAVTQTFAILAKRRRGKTYTASVMAEEMVAAKLPFVALDPTGAWWGLRASADGKRAGLPVTIIGGDHGDVPLEPTAGRVIADLVVEHPGHCVLDLGLFDSNAEQDRFATDFAERLYRAKSRRRFPLHLFVDEADAFIPQQPMPDQRRMVGAFDTLVRRGGIRGIGMTVITHRPATIHKNVLSQAEVLITLQIIGKLDRAAIDDWVKSNGTKEQREQLLDSLASLDLGETWFWSPAWLNVFKRVRIRKRRAFNSSATPEAGASLVEPKVLAKVDLEGVRARIAETVEKAKANDPKLLKQRVVELERELRSRQPAAASVDEAAAQRAYDRGRQEAERALASRIRDAEALRKRAARHLERVVQELGRATEALGVEVAMPEIPAAAPSAPAKPASRPNPGPDVGGNGRLPKGERKVLTAIVQHAGGVTRKQLTILTGYRRSTRDAYLQRLGAAGLTEQYGDRFTATAAGVAAVSGVEPLPTGAALREHWLRELPVGERTILEMLCDAYPDALGRGTIGETTEYARSSRDAYIQRLTARQLVETIGRGEVRAAPLLFEDAI